jgi:5-formyltetrahydrofolate cyclo-ligase
MIGNDSARKRLRHALRARRDALGAGERILASQALVAQLERIPEYLTDSRIAGYWAVSGELPLAALIQGLRERHQVYHLPIVQADGELRFAAWRPGAAIVTNRYGIPEPVADATAQLYARALDLILVPLLGFDRSGQRIGYGGGYYDRSLAFLRERPGIGKPLLVGVGFAAQEVAAIEAMPWDVRLDYVATESELIDCTPAPA